MSKRTRRHLSPSKKRLGSSRQKSCPWIFTPQSQLHHLLCPRLPCRSRLSLLHSLLSLISQVSLSQLPPEGALLYHHPQYGLTIVLDMDHSRGMHIEIPSIIDYHTYVVPNTHMYATTIHYLVHHFHHICVSTDMCTIACLEYSQQKYDWVYRTIKAFSCVCCTPSCPVLATQISCHYMRPLPKLH